MRRLPLRGRRNELGCRVICTLRITGRGGSCRTAVPLSGLAQRFPRGINCPMRFYAQARLARISLPLLNLALCVCQIQSAVRHPSAEHTLMAIGWGLTAFLNAITFWGTYWKVTPQGLLESRGLFVRRVIPYNIIQ